MLTELKMKLTQPNMLCDEIGCLETAYQLANEDEIAKLWTCVWALSKRLADLKKKLNIEPR